MFGLQNMHRIFIIVRYYVILEDIKYLNLQKLDMIYQNNTVDPSKLNFTVSQLIPLSIFCIIMTIFGLFGNGTVFYSSVRYNAIKLDKVSLIFVQNLAVADILYTLCVIFPQMITYLSRGWVLGKVYCFINAQLSFIPGSVNALTVLLISTYRVRLITNPFYSISSTTARVISLLAWLLGTAGTIISLSYKCTSSFSPLNAKCMSSVYSHVVAGKLLNLALVVIIMIPLLVITIENAVLCAFAIRSARRHNSSRPTSSFKALTTVCALSGVFIVSWVPYIAFTIMKSSNLSTPLALDVMAVHCIFINSFANPILYSMTNKRFGSFLKGVLRNIFCGSCRLYFIKN